MKWFLVGSLCLVCSATWLRADTAADLFNQGLADLDNQKYDDAAKAFQTIITSYPTFQQIDQAHIEAGQAYLFAHKYPEAVTALQKEAAADAKADFRAQALFLTALAQFSAAQEKSTPTQVDTAGFTTDVATLSTLINYIDANPTPDNKNFLEQSLYYRSLANYQIDKYDAAETDLLKLTSDPAYLDSLSRPDYFLQLGSIYAVETNDALDAKKHPNGADPAALQAAANKAIKAFDQAISDPNALVQANEASMSEAQVYVLLAEQDNSSDSYQKALDAYRKVRRKEDLIKAQTDRLAELRQKAQQIVQQNAANHVAGSNQLSYILAREQGKLDALMAPDAVDPVIEALIGISECYVNIVGSDGKKESDEARTILHRLLAHAKLTPDQQKSVDFNILFSYVLGGQTDKADKALTDYLSKHAGDPQADFISFQIAGELMKRKDAAGALKQAQRSLHDFPKGRYAADATTLEARALTALGRIAESKQVVEDFLKANPTSPQAYAMMLNRAANESADSDFASALADYGKVKDTAAAGAETQAAADAGYIQTLQKMQKWDELIAEAKVYETKYADGKALSIVMLFAAQALDAKHDPGAVAAYQAVARKFPQDAIVAPLALFYVVDNYRRANNVPLMTQAAKDLQAACPEAYPQIFLADDAVSDALQKQKKFDDAATMYEPLIKASDAAVAAQAQNKIGDVRLAQARSFHYQSLPPDQRPGADAVATKAEQAYVATLKNSPDQLDAAGNAIEGLLNVAKLRRSWGVLKDDNDYEPYLAQATEGVSSPDLKAHIEMAKAGLVFILKNGATQYSAALDRFKKVVAANPGLRLTRQETDQFGELLLNAKDYTGAQKVYQDLLDNAQSNDSAALAVAYYGLGAVAMAQNDLAHAKEYFTKMTSLPGGAAWNKHIRDANLGLAMADEQSTAKGDLDTAKQIYGQLMKDTSAGAVLQTKAMVGYGRLLEKQGFILPAKPAPQGPNEYAIHYYLQPNLMFLTATPEQSAEGLYLAGQAYAKAGDKVNAKKMYDTILTTYKDNAPDWVAKAQAAEAQ